MYIFAFGLFVLAGCHKPPEMPVDPVERGRIIFLNETFSGNGRTCATCHPADNNFTLDPTFIARLPKDDPLFVAEFNPDLKENFETPPLMHEFALIRENLDGFDDLPNKFVMRGIPHLLGLSTSVQSPNGPRTGWSGDGAPGDGSLRAFATGAVIQHFTKTLNRVPGVDFRLPTDEELDDLNAFMLSLGRQSDLALPIPLKGTVAIRGQEIFMDSTLGKCNFCHHNAGATAIIGGQNMGNANFDTGVENLEDIPAQLTDQLVPIDDGFGIPGDSTFNIPPLVEAAETGPFFHNNAVETIEGAVAFYDGDAFNSSPAGSLLASIDPAGNSIELDATQIVEIAAFLRVIAALENIRQSIELLKSARVEDILPDLRTRFLNETIVQNQDGIKVLSEAGLHPVTVMHLQKATGLTSKAMRGHDITGNIDNAIEEQRAAYDDMIENQ